MYHLCKWGTKLSKLLFSSQAIVDRARIAQESWKKSSFATRKTLMRVMLRYITENQETCARVAVRESGKTLLDALIGEVLVTCEKLAWLAESGEKCLVPEKRDTGRMMIMKKVRVEFIPLGVIGAIVPWNYPFHNVFNPVSAALFSGKSLLYSNICLKNKRNFQDSPQGYLRAGWGTKLSYINRTVFFLNILSHVKYLESEY